MFLFKEHLHSVPLHSSDDDQPCRSHKRAAQQDLSSDDEFEKEMAGEALSAMKLMVSQATEKTGVEMSVDAETSACGPSQGVCIDAT